MLWRQALDSASGLTKILFSFWLTLGVRTHCDSLCGIAPAHITVPPVQSNPEELVFAKLVIEGDKMEGMRSRAVRLPCTCAMAGGRTNCPAHAAVAMLPVSAFILGSMLKSQSISLHSVRRTVAMTMRAWVVLLKANFQMRALLEQIGWEEPGAQWAKYTEDFDPLAHTPDRLPDVSSLMLAVGPRMDADGIWDARGPFQKGPQAKDYKFVVRKKFEKDWIVENKIRFKLVKEETAASLAQQVELGAAIGPFRNKAGHSGQKPSTKEMEDFVDELCCKAVAEDDNKMMAVERDLMDELLDEISDAEDYY